MGESISTGRLRHWPGCKESGIFAWIIDNGLHDKRKTYDDYRMCNFGGSGIYTGSADQEPYRKTRTEGEVEAVCGGMIVVHRYHNKGAFLNLGETKQKLMTIVSLLLTLILTVVFLTTFTFRGRKILKAGLALLLGGAYSNTYDRLVREYVVDYVSFPVKNKKIASVVFNISDFCIMIGALMMVLGQKP